jgi:tetratricopeptide (TPR) repeat protein
MPRAARRRKGKKSRPAAQSEPQAERHSPFHLTRQNVSLALMILALVYSLLAGLHTVFDFDMGWHLAAGRYVVQHHVVPTTDVLSYTAKGAEWLYPVFADVLFYGIFSAWGYVGLSWFCALALAATVACLLRSPARQESGLAAALAIMAVPLIAARANPRADLFTSLFFAIFLAQLWNFHGSDVADSALNGEPAPRRGRLRLWILPLTMLLWVNFHPGFVAGLGLIFAYLLIEALELFFPSRRWVALRRLRQAWPALATTVLITLFNPYGPRIFKASLLISGFGPANQQSSRAFFIEEWAPVPLSLPSLAQSLDWRSPHSNFWWLALTAFAVMALAFWWRRFGAALLMAAALYGSMQHRRYEELLAIVVVVVGATILNEALQSVRERSENGAEGRSVRWNVLTVIAVSALFAVTVVRIADLVSSRRYIVANIPMQFGAGESWWFPERAADFVEREHLPGNIFQVYNLGGFTAWRMGPAYLDFIDGRFDHLAPAVMAEEEGVLLSPPDSPLWMTEADRRGIHVLLFSLARFSGVNNPPDLMSLCQSKQWRPVYMDEVSIVLLRNSPENRPWIDRDKVDCLTHDFTPPERTSRIELSSFDANVGYILLHLGRLSEAQQALEHAAALSPQDPSVHLALAQLFEKQQQLGDAEREYKAALSSTEDPATGWLTLGKFYYWHGRYAEARPCLLNAAQLSQTPATEYSFLGSVDLVLRRPKEALVDYDKAEAAAKRYWQGGEQLNPGLFANIAEGRAGAYFQLGDLQQAIEFQKKAVQRTPESASLWKTLGDLYDRAGQEQLAVQARQRASALSK